MKRQTLPVLLLKFPIWLCLMVVFLAISLIKWVIVESLFWLGYLFLWPAVKLAPGKRDPNTILSKYFHDKRKNNTRLSKRNSGTNS
jgi:hypothetical protein